MKYLIIVILFASCGKDLCLTDQVNCNCLDIPCATSSVSTTISIKQEFRSTNLIGSSGFGSVKPWVFTNGCAWDHFGLTAECSSGSVSQRVHELGVNNKSYALNYQLSGGIVNVDALVSGVNFGFVSAEGIYTKHGIVSGVTDSNVAFFSNFGNCKIDNVKLRLLSYYTFEIYENGMLIYDFIPTATLQGGEIYTVSAGAHKIIYENGMAEIKIDLTEFSSGCKEIFVIDEEIGQQVKRVCVEIL